MSPSADVRAIEALDRMRAALKAFESYVQEALSSAEKTIHATEEWIRERVEHWAFEVRQRTEDVETAERQLAVCEAYTDEDGHGQDCSAEESDRHIAGRRLQEAQQELETASRWQIDILKAVPAYRQEAQKMSRVTCDNASNGSAKLDGYAATLQSYASG